MADSQLFEDSFNILTVHDKKYDRVIRVEGTSTDSKTTFSLDVNNELFPLAQGDSMQLLLASTLKLDGSKDEMKSWTPAAQEEATLADMWDYVMYGKVYRFLESDEQNVMSVVMRLFDTSQC